MRGERARFAGLRVLRVLQNDCLGRLRARVPRTGQTQLDTVLQEVERLLARSETMQSFEKKLANEEDPENKERMIEKFCA